MPLTRWIISSKTNAAALAKDSIVNTLYFNVSTAVGESPNYTSLGDDLMAIWKTKIWAGGRYIDIRGYNMDDAEPRPQKYHKTDTGTATLSEGAHQIALCLSYYADRNLAGMRGRIYLGPWANPLPFASDANTSAVMTLPPALAGLGGLDVDWSLYSPKTGEHTRISNAWCDDSWDVIRSRKLPPVNPRKTWSGNG